MQFWQRLKKTDRLANVRINGERVVGVDLKSAFLLIAYARAPMLPPDGDLYDCVRFTREDGSRVELPREDIKRIVTARMNGAKNWPRGNGLRDRYRSKLSWHRVVESIRAAHPALSDVLDSDHGQAIMFDESTVLLSALKELKAKGIVALPVHDCIVVAESNLEAARVAMLDAFQREMKQPGRVSVEQAAAA